MLTKTRTHINPGKTPLFLTDVSTTFKIKSNTIRQHIRRGTFPEPTVRREPEIGWDAVDIYRWAYTTNRMPLSRRHPLPIPAPTHRRRHTPRTTGASGVPGNLRSRRPHAQPRHLC